MSLVDRSRKAIVLAAGTRNLLSDEDTFFGMLAQERFRENTPDFIQLVHNHKRFLSKFHICVFNVKKWFWLLKPFLHTIWIWICKKLTSSTPVSVWRLHHQDQGKDCQRAKGKYVVEPPDSNLGVCDTESGIRGIFLTPGIWKARKKAKATRLNQRVSQDPEYKRFQPQNHFLTPTF